MSLTKKDKEEIINIIKEYSTQEKKLYIKRLNNDLPIPIYAKEGDAGMDIRSSIDIQIPPNQTVLIPCGIILAIPEGYEVQIRPRSGLSLKTPLRITNSPGTIDSGYKGELGVIMHNSSRKGKNIYNISETDNKEGIYQIKKGDRIAQIVLCKYEKIIFEETDKIEEIGLNREGGFGSSGLK